MIETPGAERGSPIVYAPRFVGRAVQLAALGEALRGAPAVVLVEGEAGIGKSRLVAEYLDHLDGARRYLVGVCPPFREPHTLGALVDAVRQAPEQIGGLRLSPLAGALRPLFPEWAGDLPPGPEPLDDTRSARHRLFRALVELAQRLAVDILVVEDVHWADEATLEFLLFLAAQRPMPVSTVLTYRPEDVPDASLLRRLTARGSPVRIRLDPLDLTGTAELVSSMLGDEHVSADFAGFVHRHTAGVPLVVEESVRLMADRADVTRRGGAWVRRQLTNIEVPPSVRDAVLERTGRLGPDARAVLRGAAVYSYPADPGTLAAVADLPRERAAAGMAEALGAGLLRDHRGSQVSFRHDLRARAVYEAIPVPERRAMHARAGRVLEGVGSPPAVRLAYHFREAGDVEQWCRYGERAADLAADAGDDAGAGILLYDMLTGADLPIGPALRLARKIMFMSLDTERLHFLVGVLRAILDAGDLAPGDAAKLQWEIGRILVLVEDYPAGRRELERAVPGLLAHDPVTAARAMQWLARPRASDAPVAEHLAWLRRAARVTVPMSDVDRLGLAQSRVGALLLLGEQSGWDEAAALPERPRSVAERPFVAAAQHSVGDAAIRWGRYAEAERRLSLAGSLAGEHQVLYVQDLTAVSHLHLDYFTGRWAGLAERAAVLGADGIIHPVTRLEARMVGILVMAATGDPDRAVKPLRDVLDEVLRRGATDSICEPAAGLAALYLAAGRTGDALAVTDEPIAVVSAKGVWVWASELAPVRVEALVAAGRDAEAAEVVDRFGRGLRGRNAPGPRAALLQCRAILRRGDPAGAGDAFARAAAAWQALPRPYDALLAREQQSRCLLADGRPAEGVALLGEVLDGLTDLGAVSAADRVRRTLREHGGWRRGRRGYGAELSPREREVVALVVTGRSNREIADTLSRSPRTIEAQVKSAMRKLGVTSRTALAVAAVEAGIDSP